MSDDRRKDRRLTIIVLVASIIGYGLLGAGIWSFMRTEGVW